MNSSASCSCSSCASCSSLPLFFTSLHITSTHLLSPSLPNTLLHQKREEEEEERRKKIKEKVQK
jgi:hypothetical protein